MHNRAPVNNALVIGAGIAGIKAALELAEQGHQVYLCDRKPCIGGTLLQLDQWFPDDHCGMCKVLPVFYRDHASQYCLRRGLFHPAIKILTGCEIEKVEGEAGDFLVTVSMKSSGITSELCIGCGKCAEVCPVEVHDEYNRGLRKRKAVYVGNPLLLSKTYCIDRANCTRCNACVKACPVNAISLDMPDEQRLVSAGAIVLSTGFEEFDPLAATQYGYRRFPNVITSTELERYLSKNGPTGGKLVRPSDNKQPQSIAFLQCIGSRTLERNYCSSACCMYAVKEAMMIKRQQPETDVHIFFMDLRAFGKGCHRYYEKARDELGIRFTRCRIPRVMQNFRTRNVLLSVTGTDGKPLQREFDLIVLSVGQTPSPRFRETAETLGLELNRWGYCRTKEYAPVESLRKGVFVCGSASAPKDIADTLAEASAAAAQASLLLAPSCLSEITGQHAGPETEHSVAVCICNCGGDISRVIDMPGLLESIRSTADVVYGEEISFLCQQKTLEEVQTKIRQIGASHIITAGCSALMSGRLFGEIPVELVNIREELAWVHEGQRSAATRKAQRLIAMALEKIRTAQPVVHSLTETITARAVVIGGGLAGLTAALSIAERGYMVDLVERSGDLGGHLRHIHTTIDGGEPLLLLTKLSEQVAANTHITVWTEADLVRIQGHAGSFRMCLKDKEAQLHNLAAGTIVIATGAEEFTTDDYLYGNSEKVITQRELEERLASPHGDLQSLKSVVMIQCVGSRDKDRPYCSRICCGQALKNALKLKDANPDREVVILYRDLMSYGFMEEYYTLAREKGVIFARYEPDSKPEVSILHDRLTVKVSDPVLGGTLSINPDLVVLSTAIVAKNNSRLAAMLGVDLTEDGFFKEAEIKFRPVDMLRDGIFVCGLAHSPRDIAETIVQAQAAAGRACLLLSRQRISSGKSVSEVHETWCSGCELCVSACPYHARIKDEEKGVARVIDALCQACGACVSICPNKAAKLRGFTDKQVLAMLDVV